MKKLGKGTLISSAALSSPALYALHTEAARKPAPKKIRIGIIGAENSHTIGFGRVFNVERKFPGVEVISVWGETDALARKAMEKGNIPHMVKDPLEMLGKIDALIVDHRHPRYHLEAAAPFVRAGIPAFIDKPFCYRVSEGIEFLAMARELGTPVTSFSSIAQSDATFDLKAQVESMDEINQVIRFGPVDLDSQYGGVFFYGVHMVQPLIYIFGEEITKVKISRDENNGNATLLFRNGLFATLIFKRHAYGWETFVETDDRLVELIPRVKEPDPARHYVDMVEMFRTGKEPRSHQNILKCVAVLEALEKSALSGNWEEVWQS